MSLEYKNCPICGELRPDKGEKCPKCGFVYVPIDREKSTDITYINKWKKENRKRPIVPFVILGLSVLGLIYALCGYSYDSFYDKSAPTLIMLISVVSLGSSILYFSFKSENNNFLVDRRFIIEAAEKEEQEKLLLERKAIETKEKEEREKRNLERTNVIIAKYGKPAKIYYYFNFRKGVGLRLKDNLTTFGDDYIAIFDESQYLMVGDKFYPFDSIIGYKLVDDKRIIHGEQISVTSTKTSDALKTALFAMTNDTEWTIASAGNARKETVTYKDDDKESHEFTLYVNIDSISEPIIKIPIGRSVDIAQELDGLMNVIVLRNRRN